MNPTPPLARNEYREGQVLRAADLERESGYFLARDRQHAALAHIPGILRGLALRVFERGTETMVAEAELAGRGALPLDLYLEAGVAVDAFGRMVGVPRREQLRTALATAPSLLRAGRYRVELLYDRVAQGGGARGGDPCAGPAPGGGRTLREWYRMRLVAADRPPAPPALGPVLDGPPDAPEAEAPVVLGTVDWNGVDAFVGFSAQGRVYAGVRAQSVLAPDERARLELRDPGGRVAVRFAGGPEAGEAPDFRDALRVDEEGALWVRDDVDVGPDGVRFRPQRDGQGESVWRVALRDAAGASFGRKPGSKPGQEDDADPPPAYSPGDREMRVVFERADVPEGRRRVVIGHESRGGGSDSFQPAVIVYDRPPQAENEGKSTVEVWGDLFVRGTAYLTGAQRVPKGGSPQSGADDLDLLLRQLAGPLAGALRAFLTSDPEWLGRLGAVLAGRVDFTDQLGDKLVGTQAFIQKIADESRDEIRAALLADNALSAAVGTRLRTDDAFLGSMGDALANRPAFVTAVADRLRGDQSFMEEVTASARDQAITAIRQDPAFRAQIAATAAQQVLGDKAALAESTVDALAGGTEEGDALISRILTRIRQDNKLDVALADIVFDQLREGSESLDQRIAEALASLFGRDDNQRQRFADALRS